MATGHFQIDFDFVAHQLHIEQNDGQIRSIALAPRSVADFYREVMATLESMDLPVWIWTMPCEIPEPIPFDRDEVHASYDPEYAQRLWHVLVQADRVMAAFRSQFLGKVSPVHFFWGGFDLAVTRFSGRRAPTHPGAPGLADSVTREAYSHEVSNCGFWPGYAQQEAIFYAYAYPEPPGLRQAFIRPPSAWFSNELAEFVLPYDVVRQAAMPDDLLLDFFESTYEAMANKGNWNRAELERPGSPSLSR